MYSILDINAPGIRSKLDSFQCIHSNYSIFQSADMYDFYRYSDDCYPVFIIVGENGEVVGSMLAVILNEGRGITGLLSCRSIIWGGPIVKNNNKEILSFILNYYRKCISPNVIMSQFRNIYDMRIFQNIYLNHNWTYEEHYNYLININEEENELWKNVSAKRRNEIRRAEREGVSIEMMDGANKISDTYKILVEVYSRAKLPLPGIGYFENALNILGNNKFKVFCAKYDGEIIGTMYTLCCNGIIYDWYAGSFQKYYNKYPNDLLPWKVFMWGKENGYHTFDFGGAGKPGVPYGVRDYKKQFGGKLVNYGRYEQIHKPTLFKIARIGFKLFQIIKL